MQPEQGEEKEVVLLGVVCLQPHQPWTETSGNTRRRSSQTLWPRSQSRYKQCGRPLWQIEEMFPAAWVELEKNPTSPAFVGGVSFACSQIRSSASSVMGGGTKAPSWWPDNLAFNSAANLHRWMNVASVIAFESMGSNPYR